MKNFWTLVLFLSKPNESLSSAGRRKAAERELENHARQFEIKEGRPLFVVFHAPVYKRLNADVFDLNNQKLYDHYQTYGLNKGRQGAWVFSPIVY